MKKNINTLKRFFANNYGYILILATFIYCIYLCLFVYKNTINVYAEINDLNFKKENVISTGLYKKITEKQKVKQAINYDDSQNINNPFN